MIPPALKTRNLDHPDLDAFYAAAVELDMPLGVHGAPGIHLPKIGVDRFTNYIQVHCISFPFDQMTAMTALVSRRRLRPPSRPARRLPRGRCRLGAVLHRSPARALREARRLDRRRLAAGPAGVPASAGNIWATCEPEEPILPGVIDVLGDDFIMFASDYPHWDGEWPESTKHLRTRPDIGEDARAKIAGPNAQRFYGLN